jgi:hypothetical protein
MRKDGILSGVQLSGGRGGRYVGYACECRISCKFSELISVEEMMKDMDFRQTVP